MNFNFKIFQLSFFSILLIFILSSCIGNARTDRITEMPSSVTLETETDLPESSQISQTEKKATITTPVIETDIFEAMTAQSAVEAYYEFMSAQKYAEAYQLLSPSQPHRKTSEEFIAEAETFYESLDLLSIESYPIWSATLNAGTPTASIPIENDRCKRFIVEVKVEYKEGMMGAGPSGTYPFALTVIKDQDGWKIVQIDTIPDPYVCEKYK